jgi:hypothetical protein
MWSVNRGCVLLYGTWSHFWYIQRSVWVWSVNRGCVLLYGTWSHFWYIQRSVWVWSVNRVYVLLYGTWSHFWYIQRSVWVWSVNRGCVLLYGTWSHFWYIQRSVCALFQIHNCSLFLSFHQTLLGREESFSSHTCCDTGPRFFQSHSKDRPIQSPLNRGCEGSISLTARTTDRKMKRFFFLNRG